MKFLVVC